MRGFKGGEMKKSTATGKNANGLSLYSRAHVGFCKRCCPIAEKEVSALRLPIGLQERTNVLRSEKCQTKSFENEYPTFCNF